MKNEMRVILLDKEDITPITIENELEPMQKIVGGYIEVVQIGGGYIAICNEEGLLHNLPKNILGLRGPSFICRINENDPSEFRGLTEKEERIIEKSLHAMIV